MELLVNEIEELTYIKRYHNLFDDKIKNFASAQILEQNINQEYDQAVGQIKEENPYKDIYLNELQNKRDTDLDAVKCMKKKRKKI